MSCVRSLTYMAGIELGSNSVRASDGKSTPARHSSAPGRAQEGEHRQHPAVVIVAGRQVELGEDVRHVLLDRARRDHHLARDRGVGPALGDQLEHLALARRECVELAVLGPVARRRSARDDLAIERGAAGRDPLDRVDERPDLADPLLEQVADAALAGRQQLAGVDRLDVLGEDQDAEAWMARRARPRRGSPRR